ncbi:MAG: RagB/SusD family nutrient uptake outer membrane protein [Calditrichia bacterium]|nr:RagB/SusD family nutrient uptake outer membrane protein [Calditrichota bacterium]MCB0269991.1 RagB/SusD family nutrient uptake outer membrane protein [Calditrichota bacterium]MCB9068118.1 RagB/SusD family nutrient uptake outer membrane protein [Calditrichia bacterium]
MIHKKYRIAIAAVAIIALIVTACDTNFVNPNNPTEDVIFESKDGLFALCIGLNQYFTTTVMQEVVETPGISTRELGVTNTFLNINELARGGNELPPESGGITDPWVALLRAKGMAESLIASTPNVELSAGTRSGVLAYGHFYKAMCLGYLAGMWEQTVINNSPDGDAAFSDRAAVLAEAIRLLTEARNAINANAISDDFKNNVLGDDFNLLKSINAYLSRYSLMAGNYADAITFADAVLNDASSPANSLFNYDANNVNPVWSRINPAASDLKPQTNFGLLGAYVPEAGDGRVSFYLGADAGTANVDAGGQPISQALGFWTSQTSPIPVYLHGEMLLNKAEAHARLNQLPNAVTNLNLVRQKTDDPLGVNAGLPAWTGNANSQTDVLEEIYKNRAIELFLTGLRLEASRRFHPGLDPTVNNLTNERNRNFYPYPSIERDNNPNTPANPSI